MAITKEELALLPPEVFEGEMIVVDTLDAAELACKELSTTSILGFDSETKPAFKKGVSHQVALIQISTQNKCFLFRTNKIGIPDCLLDEVLNNDSILKIGLSLKDDFSALRKTRPFVASKFIDLQAFVKKYNIEEMSLQRIYATLFGKRISKRQRLTNWEAEELSDAQKMYASIDAWACLQIYNKLINQK